MRGTHDAKMHGNKTEISAARTGVSEVKGTPMANKRPKLAMIANNTVTTAPKPNQLRDRTASRLLKRTMHKIDMIAKTRGIKGKSVIDYTESNV